MITDGSSLAPRAPKKVPPLPDLSTTLVAEKKKIHSNSILWNAEGSRRLQKSILSRNPGRGGASAFPQLLKIFLKLDCYKLFPRACSPLTLTRPRTLVFAVLLRVVGEREHHDISVTWSST